MIINFYTVTSFINFITSIFLGIFVLVKNRKNQSNVSFFFLSMFVAAWQLSFFFWQNSTDPEKALFWCRALAFSFPFLAVCYMYFCLAFTGKLRQGRFILISSSVVFAMIAITDLTPYFIEKVEPMMGFNYWPMATPLLSIFIICLFVSLGYSGYLLIRKTIESKGVAKLQALYVTIGTIASWIAGILLLIPWYKIPLPPWTNALVPVYIIMMTYAITRYRLMDIRVVVKNIILFVLGAFTLYISFYSAAYLYKFLFNNVFAKEGYFLGIFISLGVITILYSSYKYIADFINKNIFSSLYAYQQIMQKTAKELSHYANLNTIADVVMENIEEAIHPEVSAFLAIENGSFKTMQSTNFKNDSSSSGLLIEYFKKDADILVKDELLQLMRETKDQNLSKINDFLSSGDIQLCVPLFNKKDITGVILLGYRANGVSYTKEDFRFLEILSRQAQIAIDNAVLYQSIEKKNKDLQELLNTKNDFLRIANHQLNTPLSIMKNAYSMIEDGSIDWKRGLDYLGNGLNRMSHVVEDFWNIFQAGGEMQLHIKKNNISPAVASMVKEKKMALQTIDRDLKIIIKKPAFPMPYVLCDLKQISHVVYNLLDNAISYTKNGEITISYELIGDYLKINIKDTGMGFTKEEKKKIGEKFFRSKNALLNHPDGSGLGLFICKAIIENNKGKLEFKSEGENKGSVFSFTLPVYK